MDNFPAFQLSSDELQRRHANQRNERRAQNPNGMSQMPQLSHRMSVDAEPSVSGADSLDDIIQNNHHEIQRRRRSMPQQPYPGSMSPSDASRRLSVMEFGNTNGAFGDYGFGMMASPTAANMAGAFPSMNHNMTMPGTSGSFSPQNMMTPDFPSVTPEMMGNMIALQNMNMGQMGHDMAMFQSGMPTTYSQASMDATSSMLGMDMGNDIPHTSAPSSNVSNGLIMDGTESVVGHSRPPYIPVSQADQVRNSLSLDTNPASFQQQQGMSPLAQLQALSNTSESHTPNFNQQPQPIQMPLEAFKSGTVPQTQVQPPPSATPSSGAQPLEKKTIYSKSGFDMLKALWLVATRKNAQVNLGAVDMSCAFVVCDVTMNDCPIIYVSDNFQNLTGYSSHEIIGQNCRFLQAPDAKVEAGTKREFVDNGAVYNLKQKIAEGKEVQQSLINYRKGGKPFLNLLTMIPIPWDTQEIRYIVGFQIDLVECPDAISSAQGGGSMSVSYKHNEIGQYIWTPPASSQWEPETGQTLCVDDVSTLLQQFNPKGIVSDWHKQSWDKMLLENADDVVHVLSLKGLFLYLSPSCKRLLEYDSTELVGSSISTICHPSDIVPVTRELKDTTSGNSVNIVFRIRRKQSGYTWFESHGSLFVEAGKGRKCIILVGRKRPVFALQRRQLEAHGGIGDSELWTKLSTSGMFLFVSSNVRSLLDLQPDILVGTSIQELMRKESRPEFGRTIEKARKGRTVTCKHEVQNRRGQVLQAHTTLYPGDASEGQKPTFLLAQTKLLKASSRSSTSGTTVLAKRASLGSIKNDAGSAMHSQNAQSNNEMVDAGVVSQPGGADVQPGTQDVALASDDNIFDELKTTRCTSWQYELRQMEKVNRVLAEELHGLLSNKKKRKRRKGVGNVVRDCANCHTRNTPEWRRGPSGQRDLCNSCGLRWAKQTGRVSPRTSLRGGNGESASKKSASPVHMSSLSREVSQGEVSEQPSETGSAATTTRSLSAGTEPNTGVGTTPVAAGPSKPPLSQPLLEGGADGGRMAAIREEREVSL